jgi:hypothetical protein
MNCSACRYSTRASGLSLQQRIAHGVHQVRLAQAHAAVDEQRVVHDPRRAGHVQRGGAGHLVGAAGHQGVEGQRGVQLVGGGRRRQAAAGRRPTGWWASAGRHRPAPAARWCGATAWPFSCARRQGGAGLPAGGWGVRRAARARSSRTGLPASSVRTASMRCAYCDRIQSSLKRLGTRTCATRPPWPSSCRWPARPSAADPGVELLFRQFGGEKLATALPQVWAHCGNLLLGAAENCGPRPGGPQLSTHSRPTSSPVGCKPDCGASV